MLELYEELEKNIIVCNYDNSETIEIEPGKKKKTIRKKL